MKRTTISLPDELAAALEREARRCGVPVSQVAREAIETRLGITDNVLKKIPFARLFRSEHTTTSEDVDDILADAWADLDRNT